MVSIMLNGMRATALLASIFPNMTSAVIWIIPMVRNQLKITRDSVIIREIVERLITALSERNSRYGVDSSVSMSCESISKLPSGTVTTNRAMYTDRFVAGSIAATKARRL